MPLCATPRYDPYTPYDEETWESFCALLASMESLVYLRVMLESYPDDGWIISHVRKAETLKPLCAVRHVSKFKVAVPWKDFEDTKSLLGVTPFKLEYSGAESREFHLLDGTWERPFGPPHPFYESGLNPSYA